MIDDQTVESITVLVVDDHPVFRQGLESLVGTQADMRLVGAVSDRQGALSKAASNRPAVVLLDLRLAEDNGLTVAADLKLMQPAPRVLVVSSHEGPAMVNRALRAGADGYVSKNAPATELLSAIRKVHAGKGPIVSKDLARKCTLSTGQPSLTPREVKILEQVSRGLSNKEVGTNLGLAEKTVKNHLIVIFMKLDASDRTHAVMIAIEQGIIDPNGL